MDSASAQEAIILPRHDNRMAPLLGKTGAVDDAGADGAVAFDGGQRDIAHHRQPRFLRSVGLGDEMVQRLMSCLHPPVPTRAAIGSTHLQSPSVISPRQ